MRKAGHEAPAIRLRRHGVRVSGGPWTLCGDRARGAHGKVILALGRAAGSAVTRSRIRRIAREVLGLGRNASGGTDLLLLARGDVSRQARRQVRAGLAELLSRLCTALARREAGGKATHG
jgi:ribonuclease P protein component